MTQNTINITKVTFKTNITYHYIVFAMKPALKINIYFTEDISKSFKKSVEQSISIIIVRYSFGSWQIAQFYLYFNYYPIDGSI